MSDPFRFPFLIAVTGGTYPAVFIPHPDDNFLDVEVDGVAFTLQADGVHYGIAGESDEQRRVVNHLRVTLKVTSEAGVFWFDLEPEDAFTQALELYEKSPLT